MEGRMVGVARITVGWFILFAAAAGVICAQGTRASINGVVRDPTGAAIPEAALSLRSLNTTAVVKATANAEGFYGFPNLVAGVYELSVTAKGFREYVRKGITVNLDQQLRLDVELEVGATTEVVEVSANASPLNYESPVQKGSIAP